MAILSQAQKNIWLGRCRDSTGAILTKIYSWVVLRIKRESSFKIWKSVGSLNRESSSLSIPKLENVPLYFFLVEKFKFFNQRALNNNEIFVNTKNFLYKTKKKFGHSILIFRSYLTKPWHSVKVGRNIFFLSKFHSWVLYLFN